MFFEKRFIGFNATAETRDQWALDYYPRVELIWGYMILLHFARLLPLDPLLLHFLSVLWKFMPNTFWPTVTEAERLSLNII